VSESRTEKLTQYGETKCTRAVAESQSASGFEAEIEPKTKAAAAAAD